MSPSSTVSPGGGIWPLMLRGDRAPPPPYTTALAVEAARLAEFLSPALAAYLLHAAASRHGRRLIAAPPARESRLANRQARLRLLRWAAVVTGAGVDVAFVGELANAHTLYPDPDLRPVARLEIVVAHGDVKQLIRHLGGHGFRAADEMAGPAVSLVADDGWAMLDLHLGLFGVAPDQVTRAARGIAVDGAIDGASLPVACLEHALLFAASAAAEAGFGRLCVREVVDAGMLLRLGAAIDWPTVHAIARASRLDGALRTLLALLVDLGLAANAVPAALGRPPRWPARRKFDRLADGFRELFAASLPPVRA